MSRALMVDDTGAVLLLRGADAALLEPGPWWFPPGGALEPGETFEDALRREIFEETGHAIGTLGPTVRRLDVDFVFAGGVGRTHEAYFLLRVPRFEIDASGWTDREQAYIVGHRWWHRDDMLDSSETFYPPELAAVVALAHP